MKFLKARAVKFLLFIFFHHCFAVAANFNVGESVYYSGNSAKILRQKNGMFIIYDYSDQQEHTVHPDNLYKVTGTSGAHSVGDSVYYAGDSSKVVASNPHSGMLTIYNYSDQQTHIVHPDNVAATKGKSGAHSVGDSVYYGGDSSRVVASNPRTGMLTIYNYSDQQTHIVHPDNVAATRRGSGPFSVGDSVYSSGDSSRVVASNPHTGMLTIYNYSDQQTHIVHPDSLRSSKTQSSRQQKNVNVAQTVIPRAILVKLPTAKEIPTKTKESPTPKKIKKSVVKNKVVKFTPAPAEFISDTAPRRKNGPVLRN